MAKDDALEMRMREIFATELEVEPLRMVPDAIRRGEGHSDLMQAIIRAMKKSYQLGRSERPGVAK